MMDEAVVIGMYILAGAWSICAAILWGRRGSVAYACGAVATLAAAAILTMLS